MLSEPETVGMGVVILLVAPVWYRWWWMRLRRDDGSRDCYCSLQRKAQMSAWDGVPWLSAWCYGGLSEVEGWASRIVSEVR